MVVVEVQVEAGPGWGHQARGKVGEVGPQNGGACPWGAGHDVDLVGRGAGPAGVGVGGQVQALSLHAHIAIGRGHLVLEGRTALDPVPSLLHHVGPGVAVVVVGARPGAPCWRGRELQRLAGDVVADQGPVLLQGSGVALLGGPGRVQATTRRVWAGHGGGVGAHAGGPTHGALRGGGHHVVHDGRGSHVGPGQVPLGAV